MSYNADNVQIADCESVSEMVVAHYQKEYYWRMGEYC